MRYTTFEDKIDEVTYSVDTPVAAEWNAKETTRTDNPETGYRSHYAEHEHNRNLCRTLERALSECRRGLEAYRSIFEYAFCVVLNANDFYGYACADATQIEAPAFDALLRLAREFGHEGIQAAMSQASKCEPIKPYLTDKFKAAKASITDEEKKILVEDEFCSDWAKVHEKMKQLESRLASHAERGGGEHVAGRDPVWEAAVHEPPAPSPADGLVKIEFEGSTHVRTAQEWIELARAGLRSHQAPSRDAGWVMVPMEATPEMVQAMEDRQIEGASYIAENSIQFALWKEVWKAALTATPGAGKATLGERG